GKSIGAREAADFTSERIESRDAIVGSQPETTLIILEDATHGVARQSIFEAVVAYVATTWVQRIQPILRSSPDDPAPANVYGVHAPVADTTRGAGCWIGDELSG